MMPRSSHTRCYQFILHSESIWSECSDEWNDQVVSWKAIGTLRRSFPREISIEKKLKAILEHFNNVNKPQNNAYVIEYQSGRLDVAHDSATFAIGDFVIVEADRGEDCGKVVAVTTEEKCKALASKIKHTGTELEVKKILRRATQEDVNLLKERKENEKEGLIQCRELVESKGINMEVIECEYQWDMKKIIFYFKSGKRIDFRDLLKDLFKLFKIRIWLCAEKKSLNLFIQEILEYK